MKKKISIVISIIAGAIIGVIGKGYSSKISIRYEEKRVEKFKLYYNTLNQWLNIKRRGVSLEKYFLDNNYLNIAIYGMGELGNQLCNELEGSNIKILYAIDKEAGYTYSDIKVLSLTDELLPVDVIVVTPIFDYKEIQEEISARTKSEIISLEDVVLDI